MNPLIDYRIGNVIEKVEVEEEEGIHFSLMRRRRRQDANILGKAGKFSRKLDSGSLPFAARIRLSLSIFLNFILFIFLSIFFISKIILQGSSTQSFTIQSKLLYVCFINKPYD
jgi:hypothetical protein